MAQDRPQIGTWVGEGVLGLKAPHDPGLVPFPVLSRRVGFARCVRDPACRPAGSAGVPCDARSVCVWWARRPQRCKPGTCPVAAGTPLKPRSRARPRGPGSFGSRRCSLLGVGTSADTRPRPGHGQPAQQPPPGGPSGGGRGAALPARLGSRVVSGGPSTLCGRWPCGWAVAAPSGARGPPGLAGADVTLLPAQGWTTRSRSVAWTTWRASTGSWRTTGTRGAWRSSCRAWWPLSAPDCSFGFRGAPAGPWSPTPAGVRRGRGPGAPFLGGWQAPGKSRQPRGPRFFVEGTGRA